jgi:hypothetical protein
VLDKFDDHSTKKGITDFLEAINQLIRVIIVSRYISKATTYDKE